MQDFEAAARRHYRDASLLHEHGRLANADHLVGFATECALKEILVRFLGATRTTGKPVSKTNGKLTPHGHLPELWQDVRLRLAGRTAVSAFGALFGRGNPFGSWSVHDRYDDGTASTVETVFERIDTARRILGHLETAKISGNL